jgi:NAD(P)-dependent dehydrogenase (short-subunit alcohol dehydrogenase family)
MTGNNSKSQIAKVGLVTGSAHGLGRAIAEAALAAGHNLVATARDPEQLADLVKRYGDRVRSAAHGLQQAGPYLLLDLLMPGGSMMALMLWHCRRRHRRSAKSHSAQVVRRNGFEG